MNEREVMIRLNSKRYPLRRTLLERPPTPILIRITGMKYKIGD